MGERVQKAMPEHTQREMELFGEAFELPVEKRAQLLQRICGKDHALRKNVESLLAAFDTATGFIPDLEDSFQATDPCAVPGTIIGRYKLLEQIGEGGFGIVFMAEQQEPVRRKVALKIIKAGMDTRQVIARFEAERQALALMDHPNIAKVLDAGATDKGRPYFVMELVQGLPITQFCEEHQLSVNERIELFICVCQAIQHAHQKGVIHRDIKPSNVLVTFYNGVPHPMVIDFGVAKAIDQRLTEKTLFTKFTRMVGTPAYMSPEQAEMSKQDVDTRSDVYSLGILLYELLTGTPPFPEKRLKEAGYAELQRIIAEEEPLRPSTALSRLNGQCRKVAANRRCEPAALMKLIRGDLDWIVLKALEKDRERRYETANGLAMDLRRHLANEPVVARPQSAAYKFQKFIKRNRTTAITVGVALLVSFLGAAGIVWLAVRAAKAQANAEAALRFVRDDLIGLANPVLAGTDRPPDRNLKLLKAVQMAAEGLEDRYKDQPLVEAEIRLMIGSALLGLGEIDSAEPHLRAGFSLFERELGAADPKTLQAGIAIARMLIGQSQYEKAAELSEGIVAILTRDYGANHALTLEALNCLASATGLAGRSQEALAMREEVLERGRQSDSSNPITLVDALKGMAWEYEQQGLYEEMRRLNQEAYSTAGELLGPNHPLTLWSAAHVIKDLRSSRDFRTANALASESLPLCIRALGEESVTTLFLRSEMVLLDAAKGLNPIPGRRHVAELSQRAFGPDHFYSIFEQMRLGSDLAHAGHLPEGERVLREAMERTIRLEGPETYYSRRGMRWLAGVYILQGRFDDAERLREQVLEICRRTVGAQVPNTLRNTLELANLYARQGKWEQAAALYQSFLPDNVQEVARHQGLYPAGVIAAVLANDVSGSRALADLALARYEGCQDAGERYEILLSLLVSSAASASPAQLLQLAEEAQDVLDDPGRVTMLAGIAAYRQGQFDLAADRLTSLTNAPTAGLSRLASFFLAMTRHQQHLLEESTQCLSMANAQLEGWVRSGDLGNTTASPREEWWWVASAIAARNEAEELIYGRRVSASIDATYLASCRAQWQPVKDLLDQANWTARDGDWAQAKESFLAALDHDYFDLAAASIHDPQLGEKLAALYVLTGDEAAYMQLCQQGICITSSGPIGSPKVVLLHPNWPDAQSLQTALAIARRNSSRLVLGMAEYRCGNYEHALSALNQAQEAYNLKVSGPAHAFAAMAAWKMDRSTLADQHMDKAEELYEEFVDGNPDDLGPEWYTAALFELAMNEARLLLGRPPQDANPSP